MSTVREIYPEAAHLIRDEDIEHVRELYLAPQAEWADRLRDGLGVYHLGSAAFRAYTDVPHDPSGRVVVVGSEHGNSFWGQHANGRPNPALVRAHAIRDIVDPSAALVYMAGDALREDNYALTRDERRSVRQGSARPIIDRWQTVIDKLPNAHELQEKPRSGRSVVAGMSQSATVAADALHDGFGPVTAGAIVEAPDVMQRSMVALGKDFMSSGGHLPDNIRLNASPHLSEIAADHIRSVDSKGMEGVRGMARFMGGLALPGNIALLSPLSRDTLKERLALSLAHGGHVVHAWGTLARVSPAERNRQIRDRLADNPNYTGIEFAGPYADHSLTNVAVLMGALARHAANGNVASQTA